MSSRKVFLDVTIKGKMVIEEGDSLEELFDAKFEDGYPEMNDVEFNYVITDSK
jgi:hypothetical protein